MCNYIHQRNKQTMSDEELSDFANDENIVRLQENVGDAGDDEMQGDDLVNVSGEEVKVDNGEEKSVDKVSKKKGTRKLFVLNSERLKGPKGVHTIEKLYEGFKFQGKGKEKEDLDRVMKRLEYWAFRLFPKLDFDDFLTKCEHLGHKKDLQVHLKKYRMGMINTDDMCIQNDIIEDEEKEDDTEIRRIESELLAQINDDDKFQRLIDETVQD